MSNAKVICDSISPDGVRLTTIEGRFRRFVLAEANTHRVISKNSASSRAIPFEKQVARIKSDLAYPEVWATEKPGMQGGDPLSAEEEVVARRIWEMAANDAIGRARALRLVGDHDDDATSSQVHKSIVNRLLEPFMWHTVVFTATSWENFTDQRCSPLAQPEIRVFAEDVKAAMEASTPKRLIEGEWHLPYIDSEDWNAVFRYGHESGENTYGQSAYHLVAQVSAARCARTSYLTHDGKRDIVEDLRLYRGNEQRAGLVTAQPPHWSPLEHVATPWAANRQSRSDAFLGFTPLHQDNAVIEPAVDHLPRVGNLLAWRSLRTEVEATRGEVTYR